MIWQDPIHKEGTTVDRLLIPGNFPHGIRELLPSAKAGSTKQRRRDALYLAVTPGAQARVVKILAPFIDTAFCIQANNISSFSILDDYVPFYERTVRKVLVFVDLLLIVGLKENLKEEDKRRLRSLLDARSRSRRPTVVDHKLGKDIWKKQYDGIVKVGE
jgi:hypothetical protein